MKNTELHPAPEWLTNEYIEKILQKYKKVDALKVLRLDIEPAVGKNENYCSIMIRIKVEFILKTGGEKYQESYIVKAAHDNDENFLKSYNPYETEMLMYEKILPQLQNILQEIGDTEKLAPQKILVDFERSAIVIEDLKISNYFTIDRIAGFDICQTKLALKKLAKFHASAAVLNERVPDLLTKFDLGIFNRKTRAFAPLFENVCLVCANFAGECPELGQYYKDKLIKLSAHFMEYAERAVYPKSDTFFTLIHGDFWTNNMMVRCNENKTNTLKDVLLIDLQFCNWTTPAIDLHYFFHTSLRADKRLNYIDLLVQYYHKELTQILRSLKFGGYIPTLHDFHIQMKVAEFYAVVSGMVPQAIITNNQGEDGDVNSMVGDSERAHKFRTSLYKNEGMQEYMKIWLPIFDRQGLLDVDD